MRIGVVAPSCRIAPETAERVSGLAAGLHPEAELFFHPQCFLDHNHFAGSDEVREQAFVEVANDGNFDALWFARGGYGSCRIAERALAQLNGAARDKIYLGYSDGGYLLAGLYAAGFRVAHGPMPQDINRVGDHGAPGGDRAVARALGWLHGQSDGIDPAIERGRPHVAFNMMVFSQLLGTPLQPDLAKHVLMLEEISEHMYRIDRSMFHITSNPKVREVAGIRLGRCTLVPDNDPPFGDDEEAIASYWCERAGIAYLGRADIGHDAENKVVPFG